MTPPYLPALPSRPTCLTSQAAAVRVSCQQLGAYASEQTPPMPAPLLGPIKATIDSIELKLLTLTADHTDPATLPLPSSCAVSYTHLTLPTKSTV